MRILITKWIVVCKGGSMNRIPYFLLMMIVLLYCIGFVSCSGNQVTPEWTPQTINAELVWKHITVVTRYKNYSYWPGHEGVQPGNSPHGKLHRVFINKVLRDALPLESRVAPPGSIIVKENLSGDRELLNITVMAKVEGFDKEHGDWYWAMYQPDGKAVASGNIPMCVSCHAASYNDYIIIKRLDEPLPGSSK